MKQAQKRYIYIIQHRLLLISIIIAIKKEIFRGSRPLFHQNGKKFKRSRRFCSSELLLSLKTNYSAGRPKQKQPRFNNIVTVLEIFFLQITISSLLLPIILNLQQATQGIAAEVHNCHFSIRPMQSQADE